MQTHAAPPGPLVAGSAERLPDLDAVAEGVIAVDGVAASLVPGDLGGVRAPVVLLAVKALEDSRIALGRDAEVDVRALHRPRAALRHLVDTVQDDKLAGARHGEGDLVRARHLVVLDEAKGSA